MTDKLPPYGHGSQPAYREIADAYFAIIVKARSEAEAIEKARAGDFDTITKLENDE